MSWPIYRRNAADGGRRLSNFGFAARRFGRIRSKAVVTAAAREFANLWPIWVGGLLLTVFCAVACDTRSVVWVRSLPEPVAGFFQWITDLGKSGWMLYPAGLLGLLLLLADWRVVNRRVAAAWAEFGLIVGYVFWAIAGSGLVMHAIKQTVGRGRPVVFDSDGAFSLIPFQFDYAQASFPSGHATTMGAVAVVIAVLVPRFRWFALIVCAVVAASRVFVAAHYPSDVAAGFLLGASFSWFFALALCHAGTVFERGPDGTIKLRAIAMRRVFLRSGGFSIAMGNLWHALIGASAVGPQPSSKVATASSETCEVKWRNSEMD